MAELMPFRDIFISLFFVAVGMLVQLETLWAHLALTLVAVAVIMGGKTLAAAVGPALMGYSGRVALLAGVAVSQIGEFSFVLAKEGRVAGLLPEPLYQQFLGVAVITMLVTPFLLQGGPALLDALEKVVPLDRLLPGFRPRGLTPVHDQIKDHVVVAGYGLNGRNLTAALRSVHAPYLIVELNAQTVRKARADGEPAFYGDATREEILRALGVDRARMLVIAISDPAATRRIVRVAREINPKLYIIARTRYVVEIPELTRLGANVVIPEEFETSIEIFSRVLAQYDVPRQHAREDLDGGLEFLGNHDVRPEARQLRDLHHVPGARDDIQLRVDLARDAHHPLGCCGIRDGDHEHPRAVNAEGAQDLVARGVAVEGRLALRARPPHGLRVQFDDEIGR